MLILKNARIIPELTEGYEGDRADIVVSDGIIQEIKSPGTAMTGEIIDLTGKTVIPGLIEGHLHLDLCGMNTFEENVQPDAYRAMRALKLAQDNLRNGYTTVRDLGDRNNIVISIAQAIDEGMVKGPTILPSGRIISPTEAGNDFFGSMYLEADSPDEFRKAVRTQYQAGAEWIKVMATGAVMNPGGVPGAAIIMEDELMEVCKTASLVDRPVSVHCHGSEGIKMAIRCGVKTVEHSTIMDDECIRMYKKTDKTYMIPTLSAPFSFVEFPELVPPFMTEKSQRVVDVLTEGMIAAREAGIKIGWGTDAGVYPGSHGNGIYEFRLRVKKIGFTPLETLIQATKNNSEIFGIDDKVGTIKEGKQADLVVLNDPPDQDIEALSSVFCVFRKGIMV